MINKGVDILIQDPTWLELLLIPVIIPTYEISKLFSIGQILELFENPDIIFGIDDANSSTLQLSSTSNESQEIEAMKLVRDWIFGVLNFGLSKLSYEVSIAESEDDDEDDLTDATILDLKSETAQLIMNVIKFNIGVLSLSAIVKADELTVLSGGPSILEDLPYGYQVTQYSLDFFKSLVELFQSLVLYSTAQEGSFKFSQIFKSSALSSAVIKDGEYWISLGSDTLPDLMVLASSTLNKIASITARSIASGLESLFSKLHPNVGLYIMPKLASWLMSWHLEVQILDFLINLEMSEVAHDLPLFDLSESKLNKWGVPSFVEIVQQFFGLDIMHAAFDDFDPNAPFFATSVYFLLGVASYNLFLLIETIWEMGGLLVNAFHARSFKLSYIFDTLGLFVMSLKFLSEITWQILVGLQVIVQYWLIDKVSLSHDSRQLRNLKRIAIGVDFVFGYIGVAIAKLLNILIYGFKENMTSLSSFFGFFLDEKWSMSDDGAGVGKFYLTSDTADNEIDAKAVLDDPNHNGAIDVNEAIIVMWYYWLYRGSQLNVFLVQPVLMIGHMVGMTL